MIRLYVTADLSSAADVTLTLDQSRYLTTVMRQGPGAALALFNGRDGEWLARIVDTGRRGVRLRAERRLRDQGPGPDLDLIVAVVKRGRVETIVEKAAELGAARVRLALTERTNADRVRIDRLEAIAMEAAEQTGRLDVPDIAEPVKLTAILQSWESGRRLMFCDEAGDAAPAADALAGQPRGAWAILIGPEGGFSPIERDRIRGLHGALPVSLGPRILRADTAAIAAMTLWQAALGDWRR